MRLAALSRWSVAGAGAGVCIALLLVALAHKNVPEIKAAPEAARQRRRSDGLLPLPPGTDAGGVPGQQPAFPRLGWRGSFHADQRAAYLGREDRRWHRLENRRALPPATTRPWSGATASLSRAQPPRAAKCLLTTRPMADWFGGAPLRTFPGAAPRRRFRKTPVTRLPRWQRTAGSFAPFSEMATLRRCPSTAPWLGQRPLGRLKIRTATPPHWPSGPGCCWCNWIREKRWRPIPNCSPLNPAPGGFCGSARVPTQRRGRRRSSSRLGARRKSSL